MHESGSNGEPSPVAPPEVVMAPWTILFRSIEDALYTGVDRLSSLLPVGDDFGPASDPLAPLDDGPLAA